MLASFALGAGCLLWFAWPRVQPAPVPALPATRAAPPALPVPQPPAVPLPQRVELVEGASAELHGVGSHLESRELSEDRVRLQLSGGAHFDVTPDHAGSFVVESAQVLVRVLGGSEFSVDPEDLRTRVAVDHGRVQIMWWNGATILHAGESSVFPPENESAFGRRAFLDRREDARAKRGKRATKHASKHAKKAHAKHAKAVARHQKTRHHRRRG